MKLESLKSEKFSKLSQDEQKAIGGGEIGNSQAGVRTTGKTRVVDGKTQIEYQSYTGDYSKTYSIDGVLVTDVTYSGTINYWM